MEPMTLADAVQLHTNLRGQVISLWTWFVAGNFAALAAFFSVKHPTPLVKSFFLVGFWLYAIGNLIWIISNLKVIEALSPEINNIVIESSELLFVNGLSTLASISHPVWVSAAFHVGVDICITLIVLLKKDTM